MGLQAVILRNLVQTAVYWADPVPGGAGNATYATPIEIRCRWEDMRQQFSDNKGNEVTSRAVVYTDRNIDEEGMLYLGSLDDLTNVEQAAPEEVSGAYVIKRCEKLPSLGSSTDFLFKAYLTPLLSFGGF